MSWRWLNQLIQRTVEEDEARELRQHRERVEQDWDKVREASRDLADLIEDALRGDDGGAHRHSR